jgi:hypothetical protein
VFQRGRGSLGIKRLEDWNEASILRHIWNLFARAGSLWVVLGKRIFVKRQMLYASKNFTKGARGVGENY